MIPARLVMKADGEFKDAKQLDMITAFGRLPKGMASGKSAVVVEITLANGQKVYGQTSLTIMDAAVGAFNVRDDEVASGRLQE